MVRVIPVDPGVAEVDAVLERAARRNRILRHVRDAVEPVVQSHAVPVHGGGKVGVVRESHDDGRALIDLDQRAWILAVEPEHGHGAAEQHPPHRRGGERQSRAVGEAHQLPRPRQRDAIVVAGAYGETSGLSVISAGGIATSGCIGGGVQPPRVPAA